MKKYFRYLTSRVSWLKALAKMGFYNSMPDDKFLKLRYRLVFGKELDLENPKTFNEKLQWLKIHDRKPQYTQMVDKYEAKRYVAERIGEQYIIPTLGVWDKFEDIDFDKLPEQFVLKCTHDSGGIVICKDKATFDIKKAKRIMNAALKQNFYVWSREWPYKNVPRRIIAERYMEDAETGELRDYKFFCFGGEAKLLFIASERQTGGDQTKFDFFDMEFNHIDVWNGHPNAAQLPAKPRNFEEMRTLAEKLSAGIPHLRVDFYEANGEVYFGELTFCHWSGMKPFKPHKWDEIMGSYIKLPIANDD